MIPLSRPSIGAEEISAVVEVLQSGMLASGERVRSFESAFAERVGVDHAVAVASGTAALHIGLMAAGIGPGDQVVVPSFTFAASANAVRLVGADPVFVDVDPTDFTIHADAVAQVLTSRTAAIMPVHLYGQMAPVRELDELARSVDAVVVEDAAQAHLASSHGKAAGAWGLFGAFSFYPTKNMTTGEGGMITTNDADVADRARLLRNQGMRQRYVHENVGLNERMTEIEAAIGLAQLQKLPEWTMRRRQIASVYRDKLDPALGLPFERPDAFHVYHQFTITPHDRSPVTRALIEGDIGHDVYYPRGTHQQAPYIRDDSHLPVTEDLAARVVSIPVRPDLTDDEVTHIIETLNRAVR